VRCPCHYLGPRLQPVADRLHRDAARYLRHLIRRPARVETPDPESLRLVAEATTRLQAMHQIAAPYFPQPDTVDHPLNEQTLREHLHRSRDDEV
jgi:hypothetical protein